MRSQSRFVSLALVAILALVGLAACGEEDEEPIVEDVTRVAVEGAPTEMPTPDEAALTAEAATPAGGQAAGQQGGGQGGGALAGTFRLEAWDIGWRTADQPGPQVEFTVPPGTVIDLVNTGSAQHTFTLGEKNNDGLPNLGIDVDMQPGFTGQVEIPADAQAGSYYFYCAVPGHEAAGMHGTLTIQ